MLYAYVYVACLSHVATKESHRAWMDTYSKHYYSLYNLYQYPISLLHKKKWISPNLFNKEKNNTMYALNRTVGIVH